MPRFDYCIFGRTLEKMDPGFISYVSFIHMECLHTHPVLVFYCSLINEKIEKRNDYSRSNKRELHKSEMNAYTYRQRALFRWHLAYTLIRNMHLVQLRKHQIVNFQLPSAESFNEFLSRKVFNRFQLPTTTKLSTTFHIGGNGNSSTIIRNPAPGCTSLLLGVDEQDERKLPF